MLPIDLDPNIVSLLISVAGSYLASLLPLPSFFRKNNRAQHIHDCFNKALRPWNEDIAAPFYEKGREESLRKDLLAYIRGEVPADGRVRDLMVDWVRAMSEDEVCAAMIHEIKMEDLPEEVRAVSSVVEQVWQGLQRLERKVDKVDAGVEAIWNKLSLTQFVCLNDCIRESRTLPGGEINARQLTDGSFWRDVEHLRTVVDGLGKYGHFVIKGSEGRGKSILSYQVAQELIEKEGFTVFVSEKSWTWEKVYKELDDLLKGPGPLLIVLENIHQAADEVSLIVDYFKRHAKDSGGRHWFLANMRLTYENVIDSAVNLLEPDSRINLDEFQAARSEEVTSHLASGLSLQVDRLTVNKIALRSILPPNLRVLSKYFQAYAERQGEDVDEGMILNLFSEHFGLTPLSRKRKECLMKLGAVNIFDVPVHLAAFSDEEGTFLLDYASRGLCYRQGDQLFLPHSTDAEYLCKALCGKDDPKFVKKVADAVVKYYRTLVAKCRAGELEESEREEIGRWFALLSMAAYHSDKYQLIADSFHQVEQAREIIGTICPSYIVAAMVYGDSGEEEKGQRLRLFLDNIETIRGNLSFGAFCSLYIILKHYPGYSGDRLVQDLLADQDEQAWQKMFRGSPRIYKNSVYNAVIKNPSCRRAIEEYERLHPDLVKRYKTPRRYVSLLSKIQGDLKKIGGNLTSGRTDIGQEQSKIESLILTVKDLVASSPGGFLSRPLSYILRHLSDIDKACGTNFKEPLMKDEAFMADVWERLDSSYDPFGRSNADFHYIAHYFNAYFPEIRERVKELLLHTSDVTVKWSMRNYIGNIRNIYQRDKSKLNREPFEAGSLGEFIEQLVLEDAAAHIDGFSYSYSDFRYFADFHNDAYPEIKERLDFLIANPPGEREKKSMRTWVRRAQRPLSEEDRRNQFKKATWRIRNDFAAAIAQLLGQELE